VDTHAIPDVSSATDLLHSNVIAIPDPDLAITDSARSTSDDGRFLVSWDCSSNRSRAGPIGSEQVQMAQATRVASCYSDSNRTSLYRASTGALYDQFATSRLPADSRADSWLRGRLALYRIAGHERTNQYRERTLRGGYLSITDAAGPSRDPLSAGVNCTSNKNCRGCG
jgi:hypothetical protein